jgi:hypothetical protein
VVQPVQYTVQGVLQEPVQGYVHAPEQDGEHAWVQGLVQPVVQLPVQTYVQYAVQAAVHWQSHCWVPLRQSTPAGAAAGASACSTGGWTANISSLILKAIVFSSWRGGKRFLRGRPLKFPPISVAITRRRSSNGAGWVPQPVGSRRQCSGRFDRGWRPPTASSRSGGSAPGPGR